MKELKVGYIDIRTLDLDRSKAFYGSVFDWEIVEAPDEMLFIQTGASPAGGIMKTPAGVPAGVSPYVSVDDCGAFADKAAELGAQVLVRAQAVPGYGSFSMVLDPWHNEISFWTPEDKNEDPMPINSEVKNNFVWLEATVSDLEQGVSFYKNLLGWGFKPSPIAKHYAVCESNGDKGFGVGITSGDFARQFKGGNLYVEVEDIEASLALIEKQGGKKVFGPVNMGSKGSIALFLDPDDNRMGLYQHLGE